MPAPEEVTMETAREREGSPDTEQNLVIGRLSEDRGYCSPTEGSQHPHHKQNTLTNYYPPHKHSTWRDGNNNGRNIYNK